MCMLQMILQKEATAVAGILVNVVVVFQSPVPVQVAHLTRVFTWSGGQWNCLLFLVVVVMMVMMMTVRKFDGLSLY